MSIVLIKVQLLSLFRLFYLIEISRSWFIRKGVRFKNQQLNFFITHIHSLDIS